MFAWRKSLAESFYQELREKRELADVLSVEGIKVMGVDEILKLREKELPVLNKWRLEQWKIKRKLLGYG